MLRGDYTVSTAFNVWEHIYSPETGIIHHVEFERNSLHFAIVRFDGLPLDNYSGAMCATRMLYGVLPDDVSR